MLSGHLFSVSIHCKDVIVLEICINYQPHKVKLYIIVINPGWGQGVDNNIVPVQVGFNYFLTRFQALIIVHYADMLTLILSLITLGLIITYNMFNLESLSYTGFWGLTTIYWQ